MKSMCKITIAESLMYHLCNFLQDCFGPWNVVLNVFQRVFYLFFATSFFVFGTWGVVPRFRMTVLSPRFSPEMVRVLSNGEVVNDDDVRNNPRPTVREPNRFAQHSRQTEGETAGGLSSIWNSANDRLRQYGLNSFSVAGYRVDPLHLVVAILGFVLSGPMMLAVVIAAIVISQSSGDNAPLSARQTGGESSTSQPRAQGDARQPNRNKGPFSGTGQRLGG